jgi:hypothetical protein
VKYFTPDLIAMGQSEDEQVLARQERLWEEAGQRYVAYLDSVRTQLPWSLRRIDEHYYLHDANIRGMGRQNHTFVIVLTLDTPPYSLVTLTYDLVGEPVIRTDALRGSNHGSGQLVDWLYDEIEMVPGYPPTWATSILLSNGWEVQLRFRDLQLQEAEALLPSARYRPAMARAPG